MQYYFPLLVAKDIKTFDSLQTNKQQLISDTKSSFETISDERIHIYYESMEKSYNIKYDIQGINNVSVTLHPEKNVICLLYTSPSPRD